MCKILARRAMTSTLGVIALIASGCATTHDQTIGRYEKVPAGAYAIVAEVRAKPGKENELRAATLPLVASVRHDPNNRLYFLHEDRETPGHFIFYEIFSNRENFEAHNAMPYVQAWFSKLPDLADGGVKVTRLKVLGN